MDLLGEVDRDPGQDAVAQGVDENVREGEQDDDAVGEDVLEEHFLPAHRIALDFHLGRVIAELLDRRQTHCFGTVADEEESDEGNDEGDEGGRPECGGPVGIVRCEGSEGPCGDQADASTADVVGAVPNGGEPTALGGGEPVDEDAA